MSGNHVFIEMLYGFKRARRNVVFLMFSILGLVGIILYMFTSLSALLEVKSIDEFFKRVPVEWVARVLPSSFPFTCAYLFNILQLFFVTVLVINGARYSCVDTAAALNVHSQGNAETSLGNMAGKFLAFTMINVLLLAFCGLLNFLFYSEVFNIGYYLFYWLTLNLPTLVFCLGLSSLVSRLTVNQGLSLVLLALILGVLALPCSVWMEGLFDPLARRIPNMFSDFTGHVNLVSYLLQRGFILFSGACFAVLAVIPYPRIHNNPGAESRLAGLALLPLALAVFFAFTYVSQFTKGKRDAFREVYSAHEREMSLKIVANRLHLEEAGDGGIRVTSRMMVENREVEDVAMVFYLNPGLSVTGVTVDGEPVSFRRDLQALLVKGNVAPGEGKEVVVRYEGKIDNSFCFLDIPAGKHDSLSVNAIDIYHFGYNPAFCGKDYKLLTPECAWYPVSVPPYGICGFRREMFTRYRLEVEHDPGLVAICQGEANRETPGKTMFTFEHAMKGISLCIGNYKRRELMVSRALAYPEHLGGKKPKVPKGEDSTRLELFYLPEHEFMLDIYDVFPREGWRDSVEGPLTSIGFYGIDNAYVTRHMMRRVDFDPTMQYPYAWLTIMEVPCNFHSFPVRTLSQGEKVQGGMVFFPEKKYSSIVSTDEEGLGIDRIWDRETDFFCEGSCDLRTASKGNTGFVYFGECPLFNDALQLIIHPELTWDIGNMEMEYYVVDYLKDHSLEEALRDPEVSPELLDHVMYKKCQELSSWLAILIGRKAFNDAYRNFLRGHLFEETTFEEFSSEIFSRFHVRLDSLVIGWYKNNKLPEFEVDGRIIRVAEEEYEMYDFKVFNRGEVPGIIETGSGEYGWIIPPGEGRAIRTPIKDALNNFIYVALASNVPHHMELSIEEREEYTDTTSWYLPLDSSSFPTGNEDEIIVDDADPGFTILETKKFNLASLLGQVETRAKFYSFAPENHWGFTVNDDGGYGFPVKGAYFKRAGKGNQKVQWETQLPEGKHEVFCYQPSSEYVVNGDLREYYYTVFDGREEHEVVLQLDKEDKGWISLGVFDFHGKGRVILNDKDRKHDLGNSEPQKVVADAVKWVKIRE